MQFLKSFVVSAFAVGTFYYAAVLLLIDAPVLAEYWVAEMIAIKKELVKEHAGRRKIIIAGASSALFGFNAEYASEQLNTPVINFGLHGGLRLAKILQEVSTVVEHSDVLILALEPPYYDCNSKLTSWQVSNIVGWDHDTWKEMSYWERSELVYLVSPPLLGQMFVANVLRKFYPAKLVHRLAALDTSLILANFRVRTMPAAFEYSAYNLNNHGDMLRTEGSTKFRGKSFDFSKPSRVCDKTASYLIGFVDGMKQRGVQVYFANTPYIASEGDLDALRRGDFGFRNELAQVGVIIDRREDLVFDRKYFLNSNLHLNAEGRSLRTDLFIKAIRNNVIL